MGLHKGQMPEQWKGPPVDHGGEPPDNTGMDARVAKLEAVIPTLATKEDLLRLEVKFHQELHGLTWKMIGAQAALVAAVFFIAKYIK